MSVRHFTTASSESITLAVGQLGFAFGPGTMAAVIRLASLPAAANYYYIFSAGRSSTTGMYAMYVDGDHSSALAFDSWRAGPAEGFTNGATGLTADKWYLVAVTKATGTVKPRAHIYDYLNGTWTHEDMAATVADSGVAATDATIACHDDTTSVLGRFFDGDIAAVGAWNVALSDAEVQNLLLFLPQPAKGLWRLNQDAVGTTVLDLTGNGANQSARTGTTIAAVNQPVGMFDRPRPPAERLQAVQRASLI